MSEEYNGWTITAEEQQVQVKPKGRKTASFHYITNVSAEGPTGRIVFTVYGTDNYAVQAMHAYLDRLGTLSVAEPFAA
jgi:hypothetical protein